MSKKLWGGRFKKKIDKDFEEFSKSISYDHKLAEYDIYHSQIHLLALEKAGVLTTGERNKLLKALDAVLKQIIQGKFKPHPSSEDIHTDIHREVEKRAGQLASKLHSLRSRNDQIVFDEKLYCLKEAGEIGELILALKRSLTYLGKKYKGQYFIGYTHTQRAQIIKFTDYLSAFCQMLARDNGRLKRFTANLFAYIGAGALAGSPLNSGDYKEAIKEILKKKAVFSKKVKFAQNFVDNVSSRDFIIEFLSILAILQMHLSRLAEDFILYSTKEFNFFNLPEEFCTGSSLMPHKKNPDFLELVRGKTGKIYGNLIALLTTMKGLPLAYNRDMQLDKEPLFSSGEILKEELKIMMRFVKKVELNREKVKEALGDESLYATELAYFLIFEGVAAKEAHAAAGRLIRYAEDRKIKIKDIPDRVLKTFHKHLSRETVKRIMGGSGAFLSRKSLLNLPAGQKKKINYVLSQLSRARRG